MMRRNSLCPCGSNKRFKYCCGRWDVAQGTAGAAAVRPAQGKYDSSHIPLLMEVAREARHEGEFTLAASFYQQVLNLAPGNFEALHMLGIAQWRRGFANSAVRIILDSLALAPPGFETVETDLGACLAAVARQRNPEFPAVTAPPEIAGQRRIFSPANLPAVNAVRPPKVSVIVPVFNHEAYVAEALESVFRQTYRDIELIVIDDGSSDSSAAVAAATLESCPFPHTFIARENRGAHATINEGVRLATGKFINILNSDDSFTRRRIEFMVAMMQESKAEWGFSQVECVDERGEVYPKGRSGYVDSLLEQQARLLGYPTVGTGFLHFNHSISTGNLFMRRRFVESLGGFRNFRYNHDWDFCLRALLESEPACLLAGTYRYRMHEQNTIHESQERARAEADGILRNYLEATLAGRPLGNPLAPNVSTWGEGLAWWLLENNGGHLVGRNRLLALAAALGYEAMPMEAEPVPEPMPMEAEQAPQAVFQKAR
jgi:glycosyltransferase involved in cell wall biosynthesis